MHVISFSGMLADVAPSATGQSGAPQGPNMLLFLIPMVVIMYFLMIRPQQQRTKQQAKMLSVLKSGDKVVTSAGIIATVITVKERTVMLRSADSKFEVTKASVTEILPEETNTTTVS